MKLLPAFHRLRSSLLLRIGSALILVGLLPLFVVTLPIVSMTGGALTDQLLITQVNAANSAAGRIDAFLDSRRAAATALAADPSLTGDPHSPAALALLRSTLEAWSEQGVVVFAVTNDAGEMVVRAQTKALPPEVQRLSALAARDFDFANAAGTSWSSVAVPIPGGLGRVQVLSDAGALISRVLRSEEVNREADMVLAEPPDRVVLGRPAMLAGLPGLRKEALSGRVAGSGRFQPAEGPEVIASWAPVAGGRLAVISMQPASMAETVKHEMRSQAAYAVLAALALAGALSFAAYRSLVRPIRELLHAERQLAGLPTQAVGESGGEIEQLKSALDLLARRVRDRQELGQVFLGRYEVIELLSGGGMGTVFRGWDPKLRRPVALKTIRLDRELSPTEAQRMAHSLIEEALTFARFNHPNIVAIYDAQDLPEAAFIAMELIEGPTLERHLFDRVKIPPELAVPLAIGIARALGAAHERGIVHHDVKPGNILLGEDGSIKVTDFGIARLISTLTPGTGRVFGTPGYLPPETFLGMGYDKRGDLFALGANLYYCLAGHHPFDSANPQEMARKTVANRPAPLRLPGWEALAELVMALLAKDWEQRPAEAAEVLAVLEPLAAARGLTWRLEKGSNRLRNLEMHHELARSRHMPTVAVDAGRGR